MSSSTVPSYSNDEETMACEAHLSTSTNFKCAKSTSGVIGAFFRPTKAAIMMFLSLISCGLLFYNEVRLPWAAAATVSTKARTPEEVILSSTANSSDIRPLRQPDQKKNKPTTTSHNKNNTNVVRELCSSSSEKCSIQQKPQACQEPQFDDKLKKFSGTIYTIPESNMTSADLASFCGRLKKSDIGSILRPSQSSLSASEVTAMVCERTISGNISGVHKFSAESSGQEQLPLIAFPAWGKSNPEDFKYEHSNNDWKEYTTGFVSLDQDMCFWPEMPQVVEETTAPSSNKQQLSILTNKDPIYAKKLLVSGGFFDNFWHAMLILNSWCTMKDDQDVSFLVQEQSKIPSFVINFGNVMGINNTRILLHDRPVVSNSDIYVAPFRMGAVDWSCLHDSLQVKVEEDELSYALVYFRPDAKRRPGRDIPLDLHNKFVEALSKELGIPVKTFNGSESFEEQRELFSRAKIFIGPHGAGFSNLVFTSNPIPAVELLTPQIGRRSWQMFGAHSFRHPLPWWPVLVKSFSNEEAILGQAVSVAKKAYLYHYQGRDDEFLAGSQD